MAGLVVRLRRIERKFPTSCKFLTFIVGAVDGRGTPDFSALSYDDLDRLEELISRCASLSLSERAELEALCERVE